MIYICMCVRNGRCRSQEAAHICPHQRERSKCKECGGRASARTSAKGANATYTYIHAYMCVCTYTYTHAYTHDNICAYIETHTYMHTFSHNMDACTQMHIHIHDAYTQMHIHAHKCVAQELLLFQTKAKRLRTCASILKQNNK